VALRPSGVYVARVTSDAHSSSGDDGFRVEASVEGEIVVLRLSGEFDLVAGQHWVKVVSPLLDGDSRSFQVDLGHVSFMDSSGLGQLVKLRHVLGANGEPGGLRLRNVPENVLRVLDYAGVTSLFDVSTA
jgi:anti-sigma B factor antagonist